MGKAKGSPFRAVYDEEKAKTAKALSQYGLPLADIAAIVGMSVDTLTKLYKTELEEGRAVANSRIGKRLYEKAMEGDTTALIFWAKCRMRWRTEDTGDGEAYEVPAVKIKVVNGRRKKKEDE